MIDLHRRPTFPLLPLLRLLAAALIVTLAACGGTDPEPPAGAAAAQLRTWAEGRLADRDLPAAIVGFRRALQQDSLDVACLVGLARVYELQERDEPADLYRRRAFHAAFTRGQAYQAAGHPDSARRAFATAARAWPGHPMAHLRLGELSLAAGQLDSAIAHFEDAVEANPRFAGSLIELGETYLQARRLEEAQQTFERAIAVNINAVGAYLGLGTLYTERGDWARAVSQYEKVLLIDPRSEPARRGLERARAGLQAR